MKNILPVYDDINKITVLLNAALFLMMNIISIISRWVTTSYFTEVVGAKFLSPIFSLNAILYISIAALLTIIFSKFAVLNITRWAILICGLITIFDIGLIFSPLPTKYVASILVITGYRISGIMDAFVWICAAQFFSSLHAKKVYPLFLSASSIGSLGGYGFIAFFSNSLSITSYLLICAALLFVSYFVVHALQFNFWHASDNDNLETRSIRKVIEFILATRYWLILLILVIIIFAFTNVSTLQYILCVQENLIDFKKVTSFFGYFGIVSSVVSLLFGLIISRIILKLGVWDTLSVAILMISIGFLFLFFSGNEIYLVSFSRIVIQLCSQLGIFAISVLCKHAKSIYQNQIISLFSSFPGGVGMFLGSLLFYLLSLNILTFSQFSLFVAMIALAVYAWVKISKQLYRQILIGGVEDDIRKILQSENQFSITNSFSSQELYKSISKNIDEKQSQLLSYEIGAKITDLPNIIIILNILEGLHDEDPEVRKKALTALTAYLSLGKVITRWILFCVKDDDLEIAGRSLIMLYELDPDLALKKSRQILTELIKIDNAKYRVLFLNIVRVLRAKEFTSTVIFLMQDQNEKVREQAFFTYGNLATVDNDHDIELLKSHLNEQSSLPAKMLIAVLCKVVDTKRNAFYNLLFSSDPFVWRNTSELLIKWQCKSEYNFIVLSAVNKIHLVYENLELIKFLLSIADVQYANILIQHLILQNEIILKGAIYVAAFKARDEGVIDSLFKEVRNINPNIKATALELIENLGDKRLTTPLIAYFSLNSSEERIRYAKKVLHIEEANRYNVLETLLLENNDWIKMCIIHIMVSLKDPYFEKVIARVFNTEKNEFVRNYAEKALIEMRQKDLAEKKPEIDTLEMVVFLKNAFVFKKINLEAIVLFANLLIQKKFKKNEVIITEGDEVLGMYIIFEGTVSVNYNHNKIATINKYSFFGIHSTIESAPSYETIIAETEVTTFFMSQKIYKNMIVLHPAILIGLLKEITNYACTLEK